MNVSPSPKRIKLESSLSSSGVEENPKDAGDLELDHCTICLQPFLDRTIIPVCAHEFCFECILLWSEQSRKCPLCSRSFDGSYLIHHIRSQYDYQKHYLPPPRSSPPPLMGESRATALRNARRERQWGRRQRRQREEADQLERAIARRRWIYHHHLYAKHVASNPYTRYRPFPTPVQFAASPDLISRMTTFLRRELRVWPNLDVEFLTTYTISLMKSIDVRSEPAVKLLSEFLDLDMPYIAGARHVNAEHFAHEIYSYLRSPYRDLNTYDQTAQYDTPPEIPPLQEIERGNRWDAEPSPSPPLRSRSNSGCPRRENSTIHSPTARHSTVDACCEDRPIYKHGRSRSPRGRGDHNFRNYPSGRTHSPPDDIQDTLRDCHSGRVPYCVAASAAVFAEHQDNNFPVQPHFRDDENENGQLTEANENIAAATETPKTSGPQGDDSAAALAAGEASVTRLIDGPLDGTGNNVAHYVDNVRGGSSVNAQPPRKRLTRLSAEVHPRNRTLSESIQAYLSRPAAPGYPPKKPTVSGDEQPERMMLDARTMDTPPRLFLRLTDVPTGSRRIGKSPSSHRATVERMTDGPSTPKCDVASKQAHHGGPLPTCIYPSSRGLFTGGDEAEDGSTGSDRVDGRSTTASVDGRPGSSVTPLLDASALGRSLVTRRNERDRMLDDEPSAPSFLVGGERTGRDNSVMVGGADDASTKATVMPRSGSGSGAGSDSGSGSKSTWTSGQENEMGADVGLDVSALERRLRAKTRVRARLKAIKVQGAVRNGGDERSVPVAPAATGSGADVGPGSSPSELELGSTRSGTSLEVTQIVRA